MIIFIINSSGFDLLTNKPVFFIPAPGTKPGLVPPRSLPTPGFHKISVAFAA